MSRSGDTRNREIDASAARAVVAVLCMLLLSALAIGIFTGTLGEHTLRPAPATSSITVP